MKILLTFVLLTVHLFATEPNTLTDQEKADGWQLLFNGKDLDNWRVFGSEKRPDVGWKIEDGILIKQDKINGGHIITKRKYKDYTLTWEWKIFAKGNNGIKYLVDEARPIAPGPEYQMLDDHGHHDAKNGPTHQTAALYDLIGANELKKASPIGEWNTSKLVVDGNHVEHWLNGAKVVTYELGSPELKAAIQKSKFKKAKGFGDKIEGHIMLTDHYNECFYRNVKILEKAEK
jgi:hypothetical protein